jgi:hypothetical protein
MLNYPRTPLDVYVNAVEKLEGLEIKQPRNAKAVFVLLAQNYKHKRIPKQRRYK